MKAIKRILIPIDFSDNSKAAFHYALDLSDKLYEQTPSEEAMIKVVHVYELVGVEAPMGLRYDVDDLELGIKRFVEDNIVNDDNNIAVVTRRKVNIETEVVYVYGSPAVNIANMSTGYDLIVMGMVGERTFEEIVFGSVATDVAQEAHCPVLLVPQGTSFKGIDNIAYACDFDHKSFKHPALVADVAQLFNTHVHLVFVKTQTKTRLDYTTDLADMKAVFEKEAPALTFNGYIIEEEDVFYGINNFSQAHQIDMLVVITKNRNFWERLFHASITKELAMYSELPLLVIKTK